MTIYIRMLEIEKKTHQIRNILRKHLQMNSHQAMANRHIKTLVTFMVSQ
jgi:hypothetical protein